MKASSRNAFTMVEVIISAVLFIVAAGGVLASLSTTRQPAIDSDKSVKAAMYAQKISETLRFTLGSDTWASAAWAIGTHTFPADAEFPGYTATYTVASVGGGKKVTIDVTY